VTGPAAIDGIGPTDDWQGYWQRTDASKRSAASWANAG
jgi:phthalate 4,5-dioxygenase oxygenase subunit